MSEFDTIQQIEEESRRRALIKNFLGKKIVQQIGGSVSTETLEILYGEKMKMLEEKLKEAEERYKGYDTIALLSLSGVVMHTAKRRDIEFYINRGTIANSGKNGGYIYLPNLDKWAPGYYVKKGNEVIDIKYGTLIDKEVEKQQTIYKIGDVVFHWKYGKGVVESLVYDNYQEIRFKGYRITFSKDGRLANESTPTLSFTPYNFIDGGFSQERPIELPDIGEQILVSDNNEITDLTKWVFRNFVKYCTENEYPVITHDSNFKFFKRLR